MIFTKKEQVNFTEEEYCCIKILAEQMIKSMSKAEKMDGNLKFVMSILKKIHKKVEKL